MNKDKCKKILFIIPSIEGGGAEKVFLNILKYLDEKKFSAHLVLFERKGEYLDLIPENIIIYDLRKKSKFDFFKLVLLIAYKIYPKVKPDIVISFLEYSNIIAIIANKFSLINKSPYVLISERAYSPVYSLLRKVRGIFIKKVYPQANKIIAVSRGVKFYLEKTYRIPKEKIRVIYNGIDISHIKNLMNEAIYEVPLDKNKIPMILACGRLTRQKNFSLLIKAFNEVLKSEKAKLLIIGKGDEEKYLQNLVFNLGINNEVIFLGFQKNPFKFIARSTIFVLSSNWEGFPNVIVEAMACGLPVVSTKCPYGPDEIITDGVNGLLVPVGDVKGMSEAILRLLRDSLLRRELSTAGRKRAEDFKIEKMVEEYESIFLRGLSWES